MHEYIVYRHGFHPVNQPAEHGLPEKMPVARIQAADPDEACRLAARRITLYDSQRLSAEPAEVVDAQVTNLDLQIPAL